MRTKTWNMRNMRNKMIGCGWLSGKFEGNREGLTISPNHSYKEKKTKEKKTKRDVYKLICLSPKLAFDSLKEENEKH